MIDYASLKGIRNRFSRNHGGPDFGGTGWVRRRVPLIPDLRAPPPFEIPQPVLVVAASVIFGLLAHRVRTRSDRPCISPSSKRRSSVIGESTALSSSSRAT
ncbi:MAG TPA: hypothetical protein VMW63_08850 [Methanoregulaceae archaeon]|nr:hypothetical protein [Methanoregulaceae archaeon]